MKPDEIQIAMARVREDYPDMRPMTVPTEKRFLELLAEPWVTRAAFDVAIDHEIERTTPKDGSAREWPKKNRIQKLLKSSTPNIVEAQHGDAVRLCVERFGHAFLAMKAVPWSTPCALCELDDRWKLLGGEPDEDLLKHAHVWDYRTLASVIEDDADHLRRFWGWTEATIWHAVDYCVTHAPDGTAMEFPHEFHPLKARCATLPEWFARLKKADEAGAERRKRMIGMFTGALNSIGTAVREKPKCGHCGDKQQVPQYAERADGSVIVTKVARWVACQHCVEAGDLAGMFG
jgi:hypothetical protein